MNNFKWFMGAGLVLAAIAVMALQSQQHVVNAQDPGQQDRAQQLRQDLQQPTTERGAEEKELERYIATGLVLGNQVEIALLRVCISQSENDELKQLAQKMLQEHEQFVQKVERYASRSAAELSVDGTDDPTQPVPERQQPPVQRDDTAGQQDTVGQQRDTQQDPRRPRSDQAGRVSEQITQFEHERAKKFVQLVKAELRQKQGSEFDLDFVMQQIGMHVHMLAKLNAAEEAVSGEFQQIVREGHQTAIVHQQELKRMKEQLMYAVGR